MAGEEPHCHAPARHYREGSANPAPEQAGPESRKLIETWASLHAVRPALGALATAIFLWASLA